MKPTPSELRARDDAIFYALEHAHDDRTSLGKLYRDGGPTPEAYLAPRIRVLFVFREPNMRGEAYAHDMRDEVSDVRFRPLGREGAREDRSAKGWWNRKAGMFAHAVAAALTDDACEHRDSVCRSSPKTSPHDGEGMDRERWRPARAHRPENPVEHRIELFGQVLGEKAQYEIAILLEQLVLPSIATVSDWIG